VGAFCIENAPYCILASSCIYTGWVGVYIYIYEKFILHTLVATPTYVSHDVGRIGPNERYVRGVCDHTRPSVMVYTLSM
jgi:hypothetical protein